MAGKKKYNLVGQKFGRWYVQYEIETNTTSYRAYHCICDCGNERDVRQRSLLEGTSTSCGCYNSEIIKLPNYKKRKENIFEFVDNYAIGYTSKGEKFYIDAEDVKKVKKYCWSYNDNGYVVASMRNGKKERLSRFIMGINDFEIKVDHINHNLSDNRKSNLRITNQSTNGMNRVLKSCNTSGVTGVHWDKSRNKWMASIMINYKNKYLGRFDNFDDAVKARKEAEEKYFGEFSYDNSQKIANNF